MFSFVAFGLRRIILVERNHSRFALFVSLLCVGFSLSLSLSLPVMPLTAISGKSRL
jgi:hypothetical protein